MCISEEELWGKADVEIREKKAELCIDFLEVSEREAMHSYLRVVVYEDRREVVLERAA